MTDREPTTAERMTFVALAEARHARGSGAALLGAGQYALASVLAPLVGAWGEQTATPMGVVGFTVALLTAACAFWAMRSRVA